MILDSSLHYASLLEVAALIASRDVSPVALTEQMLTRIAAVDPSLHAYLRVTADSALAEAERAEQEIWSGRYRGPLHGVPIAIKDLFHTRGVPSTFGSLAYKDFVAEEDATAVRRLRMAGAVILGRLHLHEGAYGEHHPKLPKCLNPWNSDYWPGGSSSGSGAATAAGLCFGSLGTDTGGSIRFPSAANGVTGLKPTWGRTSRYGVFPLADSLDTIGPMARNAADAAALFDVLAGADPRDPTTLSAPVPDHRGGLNGSLGARGLRIGIDEAYLAWGTDMETATALRAALAVFQDLGAVLVPVKVPDRAAATDAQIVITDAECARFHHPVYRTNASKFGPHLTAAIERGLGYTSLALTNAYIVRDRFKGEMTRLFADVDALISPIYPMVGARYDEMARHVADLPRFLGYTAPFNVSGSPCITFPCGLASVGVPLGIQLIGPHLSEPALFKAVHAYQQATDWHTRRPPGF
ncbi:amidase [Lichenifustis flavocetrariae]|uniref:Indoleacetamide hydrolase n=1 Tax=Lichenifustis flavocetrariae TaxID=2949735 RepID=A0AA41YS07_9HYPH|nr:amidase [Lichenifustis flavocetrariae]MCW6507461.1 amidase [Lichenifustis flavocetrariae]